MLDDANGLADWNVLTEHYSFAWNQTPQVRRWTAGPAWELPSAFHILEFPPTEERSMWTYATCGMSQVADRPALELHLVAPGRSDLHVELLTCIAHYHRTGSALGLHHLVNFGRPWLPDSRCDHGLISLPYLDGPRLQNGPHVAADHRVECLWLLPITNAERQYIRKDGVEAFEQRFEEAGGAYLDPLRASIV